MTTQKISGILGWRGTVKDSFRVLKQQDGEVTAFSGKLRCGLLDYATVCMDGRLILLF